MQSIEITDPASEIAALFSDFANLEARHRSETTEKVLSRYFKLESSSPAWFELVGILASRLRALNDFVAVIQDQFMKDRMRTELLSSIKLMSQIVSSGQMQSQWENIRNSICSNENIAKLESFAIISQKYKPLRLVSKEVRIELIDKIDEILAELEEPTNNLGDIPKWAILPIIEGLETTHKILTHFKVFGCRAAIDEILKLSLEIDGIANSELPEEKKKNIYEFLKKAMHVTFFVGEALLLPANAYQGYHVYRELTLQYVLETKEERLMIINEKSEQKALPPPRDIEDNDAKDKEPIIL